MESAGWLVLILLAVAVAMNWDDGKTKEGFWWYYPCIYNAQNRMVCNPGWQAPWSWSAPIRYPKGTGYDLRGDAFPYDGYLWGNEGIWRYRTY